MLFIGNVPLLRSEFQFNFAIMCLISNDYL